MAMSTLENDEPPLRMNIGHLEWRSAQINGCMGLVFRKNLTACQDKTHFKGCRYKLVYCEKYFCGPQFRSKCFLALWGLPGKNRFFSSDLLLEWTQSLAADVAALAHDAVLLGEALDAPHEVLRLPVRRALFKGLSKELPPL